ncbi:unnamed protein product, partial [Oikopleura dioica]
IFGSEKGHGLVAENEIHKGEFIIEYMGEYLNLEAVNERQVYQRENDKMNYILSLAEVFGNGEKEIVHIDAGKLGNAARFANHSCSPNSKLYPVRVENDIARIAIFAERFIEPGEEITYDYGSAESTLSERKCQCGSRCCRHFMPSDINL